MKGLLCLVALAFVASTAWAQARQITGTVTDASSGFPLPGVNIVIQGTTQGTTTGIDGDYSLQASSDDILVYSFVGYLTQEIPVGDQSVIDVDLQEDVALLEDVVVVGYGTQRKADITGAVSSVQADEANVGIVTSPEQLLQGRVAGVQLIQNNGEPGSSVQVRIRGGTSISASNEPLYVVDGVPIDASPTTPPGSSLEVNSGSKNPLTFLNPSDIESIDILKDASAAAIYGSRGANGVVLITTKRGREGQVQVDYSGYVGTSSLARKLDLLTASEYRNFMETNNLSTANLGNASTDWQDALTRDAVSQNHSLAFSGGTSSTRYRASLSYLDQEGILVDSGIERLSGRVNIDHQAFDDKLRLALNLTTSYTGEDHTPYQQTGGFTGGLFTNMLKYNPTNPVTRDNGEYFELIGNVGIRNPVAMAEQIDDFTKTTRALGNFSADYMLVEGLSVKASVGFDRAQASRRSYVPRASPLGQPVNGEAVQGNLERTLTNFELTSTYTSNFAGLHDLTLLGGYSWQSILSEQFAATARDFVTDIWLFNNLAGGGNNTIKPTSFAEESKLVGFFGRVNYGFDSKYLLTATLRRDGSSRFGADNKWGWFPSFSVAWRLSEEPFMQNVAVLDDLKLRAGWGITGSQEIGNLRSIARLEPNADFIAIFGRDTQEEITGVAPANFANPDLRWEETTQINLGLDFSLWSGRLSGSMEVYQKNTNDLLLEFETPQPAAVPTFLANAGEVENRGFEMGLNAFVYDRNDLTVEVGGTLGINRNEVVSLGGREQIFTGAVSGAGLSGINAQILTPGEPFGTFWGPTFLGIENGSQQFVLDEDGNRALGIIGAAQPDFIYGLTTSATWKSLDLSLFFRGQQGAEVFNNTGLEYTTKNLANNNINFLAEALTDGTSLTEAPVYSSRWIQDASFFRLDNATLGYTFSNITALQSAIGTIRSARIYVSGSNLFVITPYDGYDPEVNTPASSSVGNVPIIAVGIDYTNYPRPRTFTVGVNIGF